MFLYDINTMYIFFEILCPKVDLSFLNILSKDRLFLNSKKKHKGKIDSASDVHIKLKKQQEQHKNK